MYFLQRKTHGLRLLHQCTTLFKHANINILRKDAQNKNINKITQLLEKKASHGYTKLTLYTNVSLKTYYLCYGNYKIV